MQSIFALAGKDLRLLLRDRGALFFAIGFPLLMAVFFGTIFGGGGGDDGPTAIRVAALDADGSARSEAFLDDLAGMDEFDLRRAESREAAIEEVRRGLVSAAVIVEPGFGDGMQRLFYGDSASIEIVYDPSRGAERQMLTGMITQKAYQSVSDTFQDPEAMQSTLDTALGAVEASDDRGPLDKGATLTMLRSVRTFYAQSQESWMTEAEGGGDPTEGIDFQPVEITSVSVREVAGAQTDSGDSAEASPGSGYAVSFPQGVIWALLGVSASFSITLVVERTSGTLRRLRLAPISRGHVLAGKALACLTATLLASAAVLSLGVLVFGVRPTSPGLLAIGVLCGGLCFVGIMMLLSTLGRSEQAAAGVGWAVLLILGMFGGAMVPLFIMPEWMQSLASLSPVKWAILAIEGPLWRGFSAGEMLAPCAVLLAVGAAAFILGAWNFARTEES